LRGIEKKTLVAKGIEKFSIMADQQSDSIKRMEGLADNIPAFRI